VVEVNVLYSIGTALIVVKSVCTAKVGLGSSGVAIVCLAFVYLLEPDIRKVG
jgi:hypothetical protein